MANSTSQVYIDTHRVISDISPLIFSGFLEHLGRAVYEGVYDPGSPQADERGFRKDVMAAMRELNFRTMRYPGGNFVSGYRWQDGVGPKDQRPRRRDLAWQTVDSNQFGTDEFMEWCREVGTEPMMAVNLGTAPIQEAGNLVEYCNGQAGTQYADMRVANGHRDPYNVKYWCLGNEMDGPWQIGHLEAEEYGRKAREAAKIMRWHDPSIEMISCGSSNSKMPTFPEWDRVVLEHLWENVHYHSMHYYAQNHENDTTSFLASSAEFEHFVDTLSGVLRYVKAKTRSKRDVYLTWDEWNVWYKATGSDHTQSGWKEAPHLLEEIYNLEDALVVAQWMNVFLRRADVIKVACLAQVVNVIAPVMTNKDGLLKQTIYYPFMLFSKLAAGTALDVAVKAPMHETTKYGEMPMLDVSASYDEANNAQAVFIVNRDQTNSQPVQFYWQDRKPQSIKAVHQLSGTDPKAANTFEQPDQIKLVSVDTPQIQDNCVEMMLPPLSFTVLEVGM
jgi:alpha-L-arabinofuranosidase